MSDVVITPSTLPIPVGARTEKRNAGETIAAGAPMYIDPSTKKWMNSNASVTGKRTVDAIAMNGATLGNPIIGMFGPMDKLNTGGSSITKGRIYILAGDNPGAIAPIGDLTTTWGVIIIGVGADTANIELTLADTDIVM